MALTLFSFGNKSQETLVKEKSDLSTGLELVFFMNPRGLPCKMQDKILKEAGETITNRADIVYVKTTVSQDRKKFYEHGIRSLPAMILLKDGKEAFRFSPGIQQLETITAALDRSEEG